MYRRQFTIKITIFIFQMMSFGLGFVTFIRKTAIGLLWLLERLFKVINPLALLNSTHE